MSKRTANRARLFRTAAPVFAALGAETRLGLLAKLSDGNEHSVLQLTEGMALTRQAVSKHLCVLESAGLVCGTRRGRESLFKLTPEPLSEAMVAMNDIAKQWDHALYELKKWVE